MGRCPDCCLPKAETPEEAASSPDTPWCECPILKVDPYLYDEEEDQPEEVE
jgi:hypothetical protein